MVSPALLQRHFHQQTERPHETRSLLKISSDVETIANCANSAKALRNDWVCCNVACGLLSRYPRSPADHGARMQVREVEFAACKVLEPQSMIPNLATINNRRCSISRASSRSYSSR
jgi:hypothetical protein